jgi:hypothetical protein
MQQLRFKGVSLLIAAGLSVVITGCSSDPLAYDNFRQIRVDASRQWEVEEIIGEPSQKLGDQWLYERPSKHLTALIEFNDDGVVTRKQWIDAMSGVWDDSEPETVQEP